MPAALGTNVSSVLRVHVKLEQEVGKGLAPSTRLPSLDLLTNDVLQMSPRSRNPAPLMLSLMLPRTLLTTSQNEPGAAEPQQKLPTTEDAIRCIAMPNPQK